MQVVLVINNYLEELCPTDQTSWTRDNFQLEPIGNWALELYVALHESFQLPIHPFYEHLRRGIDLKRSPLAFHSYGVTYLIVFNLSHAYEWQTLSWPYTTIPRYSDMVCGFRWKGHENLHLKIGNTEYIIERPIVYKFPNYFAILLYLFDIHILECPDELQVLHCFLDPNLREQIDFCALNPLVMGTLSLD